MSISTLSKDEAFRLLFEDNSDNNFETQYIDEYGNYVFPTDLVADTPNTAIGAPNEWNFLLENTLKTAKR